MSTIRYRWEGEPTAAPTIGCYLVSTARLPRTGYLIVGVTDRGKRGGLGQPVHTLLILQVERVPVAEARSSDLCWSIEWDKRSRRRAP